MTLRNLVSSIVLTLFALALVSFSPQTTLAQGESQSSQSTAKPKDDDTNLDTQLYLIVGTNQEVNEPKLPAALDPVIKQLRSSLPYKNYRLATTLINRVKSDGRLSLRWAGGPLVASAAATARTPGFNEFYVRLVRLVEDAEGHKLIRMEGFKFGARIPIETYSAVASTANSVPVINYENTGLDTDISMREGEPVVVGTLNVGPTGEAIIVAISAKRTPR
jgi:hypothetical protein